ncbi:MAG TPA: glycoside hydrolase family 3 N-terminal domain-containing protein [bacterium]|nr:glycoside hydrolase family 3 N-terminal domain-containing protein [bacterium]
MGLNSVGTTAESAAPGDVPASEGVTGQAGGTPATIVQRASPGDTFTTSALQGSQVVVASLPPGYVAMFAGRRQDISPDRFSTPEGRALLGRAISIGADELYLYLKRRTKGVKSNVQLGPNIDMCYFWRLGGYGGVDSSGTDEKGVNRQKDAALKAGMVDVADLPPELLDLMYLVNFIAREDGTREKGTLTVLKHFPGGPGLEYTESKELIIETPFSESTQTFLAPFIDALQMKDPPRALMIAHTQYSFERDLRSRHPEFEGYYVLDKETMPASLSPAMIRGYLRGDLGFKGLTVSDWVDMPGVGNFVYNAKIKGMEREFEQEAKKVVLLSYSGINWAGGLDVTQCDYESVQRYYDANPEFQAIFDGNITEGLYFAVTQADPKKLRFPIDLSVLDYDDLHAPIDSLSGEKADARKKLDDYVGSLSMAEKVSILGRKISHRARINPDIKKICDYYYAPQDIWNRGGVVMMILIRNIISELDGYEYPRPPTKFDQEEAWVKKLMGNARFRATFDLIDWNSPEIRAMLEKEIEGLKRQE